jgi:hypothetical protein
MKKFLIALAAGGAVAASAAPALAQAFDAASVSQREDSIRDRIDDSMRNGDLTFSQADRLRGELRQIRRLDVHYRYDGMQPWEVRDIDSRLDLLESRVSYDISMNTEDREYGFGYGR